MKLFTYEAS